MNTTLRSLALTGVLLIPAEPASDAPESYSGRAAEIEVATPALDDAGITIDGRLDDAAWQHGALLHSFTQYQPLEGVEATQDTEVQVLVDRRVHLGADGHELCQQALPAG